MDPPLYRSTVVSQADVENLGLSDALEIKFIDSAKGRGVFAKRNFKEGDLVFSEPPLVAVQSSEIKNEVESCASCMRFVGSLEDQLRRAAPEAEVAELPDKDRCAVDTTVFPLPQAVRCTNGCAEVYCGAECRENAFERYHRLLCPGKEAKRFKRLRQFECHAVEHNDDFRAAAVMLAAAICQAQKLRRERPELDREAIVRQARLPFERFVSTPWWKLVPVAEDFDGSAADWQEHLYHTVDESLALLRHVIGKEQPFADDFLSVELYGHAIGALEMNCLAVVVLPPLQVYFHALADLDADMYNSLMAVISPDDEHSHEPASGGGESDDDDDEDDDDFEFPAVSGTGLYCLHSLLNHSCEPNVHAFKDYKDRNNNAVIVALRDIACGEELTISYIDEDASPEERSQMLELPYMFRCSCSKCRDQR
eukprot:TRINITY_DN4422_c0_g1_i1.p1 TRINITY_DN4422_c0_g1~~TRINITY_DN4422_c0_g1_i1.p1  ORF type:complete len:437 (-),score=140.73 TRINITY_DN4422_c0_g1_i1:114-1385(-)